MAQKFAIRLMPQRGRFKMEKVKDAAAIAAEIMLLSNIIVEANEALVAIADEVTALGANIDASVAEVKPGKATVKIVPKKEDKPLTLEDVRAVLAEKARAGYKDEVRALLQKHGADRLSAVDAADYVALIKEAEVLGNAE